MATSSTAGWAVSGCDAGRVILWSQPRGMKRIGALQLDTSIEHLFASAGGERLAVAGRGGELRIFSVEG